ncbi:MAG: hypothetical protein ACM31D_04740 [Bacteroidota bacterium]
MPRPDAVSETVYTEGQTTSQAVDTGAGGCGHAAPGKSCPWCGKAIASPRRNQTYCSAACRAGATDQKRKRNTEPKMDTCPHCGTRFEKTKKTKVFCSTDCQQAFNNHWKAHGPRLALAMFDWRVGKKAKGMTKVCQEFSRAREAMTDKRSKAHAVKGNTTNTTKKAK